VWTCKRGNRLKLLGLLEKNSSHVGIFFLGQRPQQNLGKSRRAERGRGASCQMGKSQQKKKTKKKASLTALSDHRVDYAFTRGRKYLLKLVKRTLFTRKGAHTMRRGHQTADEPTSPRRPHRKNGGWKGKSTLM